MAQQTMYPAQISSPGTELAAAATISATELTLQDASKLPAAPNLATIGSDETAEVILYTGKTGNKLTGVTRGFQGAAKSWSVGTRAARYYTAYDHDTFKGNIEDLQQNKLSKAERVVTTGDASVNFDVYDRPATQYFTSRRTGALVIVLPKGWATTMLRISIRGHNFTGATGGGGGWNLDLTGYSYPDSQAWLNASAELRGYPPFTANEISLGFDAALGRGVIVLGSVSTSWDYATVEIENVHAVYKNTDGYDKDWRIETRTDISGITKSVTPKSFAAREDSATKLPLSGGDMTGAIKRTYNQNARHYQNLAAYYATAGTTGAVKIILPRSFLGTFVDLVIRGYDYGVGKGAWELRLAAHASTANAGTWVGVNTAILEGDAPFATVTLGADGANACIILGGVTTTWSFTNIEIAELTATNFGTDGWESGWNISLITDISGITKAVQPTLQKLATQAYADAAIATHNADYVRQPGYTPVTRNASDVYAASLSPAPTNPAALPDGFAITIVPDSANTTTGPKVQLNNGVAIPIRRNPTTNYAVGAIKAGVPLALIKVGNYFLARSTAPSGTASPSSVLAGKTFMAEAYPDETNGTIPTLTGVRLAQGVSQWGDGGLAVYPEEGYQKGGPGDGEIKVSVAQLQAADADLTPDNIRNGTTIYGITGTLQPAQSFSQSFTLSGSIQNFALNPGFAPRMVTAEDPSGVGYLAVVNLFNDTRNNNDFKNGTAMYLSTGSGVMPNNIPIPSSFYISVPNGYPAGVVLTIRAYR